MERKSDGIKDGEKGRVGSSESAHFALCSLDVALVSMPPYKCTGDLKFNACGSMQIYYAVFLPNLVVRACEMYNKLQAIVTRPV